VGAITGSDGTGLNTAPPSMTLPMVCTGAAGVAVEAGVTWLACAAGAATGCLLSSV
jgi:hypothetical protein